MDDEQPPLIAPSPGDAAQRSLVEDVRHLIEDGRTLLEAELAYHKSRAAVAGAGARSIAGWAGLAIALILFALMALTFGLVLGLAEWLGPWAATAITVLALLVAAALCGWVALHRFRRISRMLGDKDEAE